MTEVDLRITVSGFIILILVAGVFVGISNSSNDDKQNLRLVCYILPLMPVDFTFKIESNTSWSGTYTCRDALWNLNGDGVKGNNNITYYGKGVEGKAEFYITNSGYLTLTVMLMGKTVYSKTINQFGQEASCKKHSPFRDLIYLSWFI